MNDVQLTMSVSGRIYQACQLDDGSILSHYGLTYVPMQRRGYWYTGPVAAWRRLASDVDYRAGGDFSDGVLATRDGLNGRINKALSKIKEAA